MTLEGSAVYGWGRPWRSWRMAADHAVCSWAASPSLKGDLGSKSACLPQFIHLIGVVVRIWFIAGNKQRGFFFFQLWTFTMEFCYKSIDFKARHRQKGNDFLNSCSFHLTYQELPDWSISSIVCFQNLGLGLKVLWRGRGVGGHRERMWNAWALVSSF